MHERDTRSLHLGSDRRRGRVRFRVALARLVLGAGSTAAWRLRAALAVVAVAGLAVGATAIVTSDDSDDTAVRADGVAPSTTMTLAPPTTGTTNPEPAEAPPPGRRRLAWNRNFGWELLVVDDGSRCLELVVGPWTQGSILCGAAPADDLIGDVEAVATPIGSILVAVVEPTVTPSPFAGPFGEVASDPEDERVAYAVLSGSAGSGRLTELMVNRGDDTVARLIFPGTIGRITRSQITVVTGRPYGRWPGYRHAGGTGLFFGGLQGLGFYDGPGGVPCVLYRRFGGAHEEVIAESCPARDTGRLLVFTQFTPIPLDTPEPGFMFLGLSDQRVTAWRCERPTGESCGAEPQVFADPSTGRVALAQFVNWVTPGAHDHVVLVLTVGGEERRVSVPVRP